MAQTVAAARGAAENVHTDKHLWVLSLGSLALAFGAVVLTEKFDTSFHSVDELRAFVKVPALATIRLIPTKTAARRRRQMLPVIIVVFLLGLAAIAAGAHYSALNNEQLLRLAARVGG